MAQPWPDYPEVFLRGLEQTAEGCEWLLRKWKEMDDLCQSDCPWTHTDRWKFIRLQGLQPCEAVNNAFINRQFLAFDVVDPGRGLDFWRVVELVTPQLEPAFNWCAKWRELVPRPADWNEACAILQGIVADQIARLQELIAEHKEIADEEEMERLDRAAFEASLEMARFQRIQNARGRELHKTLELIMKMRKEGLGIVEEAEPEDEQPDEPDPGADVPTVAAEPAPDVVPIAPAEDAPTTPAEPSALALKRRERAHANLRRQIVTREAWGTIENAQNEAKSCSTQDQSRNQVKLEQVEREYAERTQLVDKLAGWLFDGKREGSDEAKPESAG